MCIFKYNKNEIVHFEFVRRDRFSEDIDLSMNRKSTESERKASKELIIQIAESLGMTLANPDKIRLNNAVRRLRMWIHCDNSDCNFLCFAIS